jgi:hypothetical protein
LQEELCARIPEADKKSLRIALGLEKDEAITRMQTKKQSGRVIYVFSRRTKMRILSRLKIGMCSRNVGTTSWVRYIRGIIQFLEQRHRNSQQIDEARDSS